MFVVLIEKQGILLFFNAIFAAESVYSSVKSFTGWKYVSLECSHVLSLNLQAAGFM